MKEIWDTDRVALSRIHSKFVWPTNQAMSSKQDVTQSHLDLDEKRKALNAFWSRALDEDGNFDWIFGDPSDSACML